MVPCRVAISPRRAAPSVARIRKESLLIAFVILSRRAASAKREAAERGEGSQDAQTPAETSGIQRNLGSLRSFAVLRGFAFGYVASAVQDDSALYCSFICSTRTLLGSWSVKRLCSTRAFTFTFVNS